MIKRFLICILLAFSGTGVYAQLIEKDSFPSAYRISFSLFDFPYMKDAAKAEALRRADENLPYNPSVKFKDYGKFYRNLSMQQSTELAAALHGGLYYGHNALWNKIMPVSKSTKHYILNRLFANITALGTDYLAIKLPYGYAFQHEEFHRSVMATRNIYSFDEVWKFGKGLDIAVTSVKDEDLIYLKQHHPADQVRLSAAGVEGEYMFMQKMRSENFFNHSAYPFLGLSILGTFHAINYVNLPFTERFNDITDSILAHDKHDILARDFTGYDFSAWVYDLFTPGEPYDARGQWPDGTGIKRPVHASQLTEEMKEFLRETGNMQYLNLISPFMVGINKLQFKPGVYFNFALRSVPTSFGYYAGGDFFLDIHSRQFLVSLGMYRSRSLRLPAMDIQYMKLNKNKTSAWNANLGLSLWLQPEEQKFFADKSEFGFMASIKPEYAISRKMFLHADISYKTAGWVFGNPYLDSKFSGKMGFGIKFR